METQRSIKIATVAEKSIAAYGRSAWSKLHWKYIPLHVPVCETKLHAIQSVCEVVTSQMGVKNNIWMKLFFWLSSLISNWQPLYLTNLLYPHLSYYLLLHSGVSVHIFSNEIKNRKIAKQNVWYATGSSTREIVYETRECMVCVTSCLVRIMAHYSTNKWYKIVVSFQCTGLNITDKLISVFKHLTSKFPTSANIAMRLSRV